MSWKVDLNGTKEEAKKSADVQSDANIANGYQTAEQKAAVGPLIDAIPGDTVSGYVSGHNNEGDIGGGTISASLTGSTAPKEAQTSSESTAS